MKRDIYLHAKEESWWDGPERFKGINRNEVSMIQTESLIWFIKVFLGNNGIDVGGPTVCGGNLRNRIKSINIIDSEGVDIIANGDNLPFEDESLDYVFSSHTLEHIENTENVLKEWLRAVKKGGFIILVMPDKRFHLHDPNDKRLGAWAPEEKPQKNL